MIKLTKKAIELLDAVTSVAYSRKGLGYTIGRGMDTVLPVSCYSYWFSCSFDQRGKLMKALQGGRGMKLKRAGWKGQNGRVCTLLSSVMEIALGKFKKPGGYPLESICEMICELYQLWYPVTEACYHNACSESMLLSCCSCLSPTMETSCQHVITL
jgi:hypothetical protein